MPEYLTQENALDKLFDLATNSDSVVILTYSASVPPIEGILSRLKAPRKIRIMYSVKSGAQKTIDQLTHALSIRKEETKAIEAYNGSDRFQTAHAKIYFFCKTFPNETALTFVVGSFNLTLMSWSNIEAYGVYSFGIKNEFLNNRGLNHFLDLFGDNDPTIIDFFDLNQHLNGQDKEIGYNVLLLLLRLWFNKDIPVEEGYPTFENIDLLNKGSTTFVSTFGNNSLFGILSNLLRSAIIQGNENGETVELLILTPFHTEQAILKMFSIKNHILDELNLKGKVKFRLKLLTNNFNVSPLVLDKSSFSNPGFLRKIAFDSEHSAEFKVKFWGHNPSNENYIHAKIYGISVGEKKAFLLTSANLTMSAFGFDVQKNLEVGVIETQISRSRGLMDWLNECWDSEYAVSSTNDPIWVQLQNWYERLEETGINTDFEIDGLTDFRIYETHSLRVKNKKSRDIESMKLIMSFPKKEKPVKNLEKTFGKNEEWFLTEISLNEEHLGLVFCDIIATMVDGTYLLVSQQKIIISEKFPTIEMTYLQSMEAPKILLNGTIPIQLDIEIGKGIKKIDLTKISFGIQTNQERIDPKIVVVKEKSGYSRIIQILLWPSPFNASCNPHLVLFYQNLKVLGSDVPKYVTEKAFQTAMDPKVTDFLKQISIQLLTDKATLCPNVKSQLSINGYLPLIDFFGINRIIIVRDFEYTQLVGMAPTRKKIIEELQLESQILLNNNSPQSNPPTTVDTWLLGTNQNNEVTTIIPLGHLTYQLLKNPPKLSIGEEDTVKTSVTPINLNFYLHGQAFFKDELFIKYHVGDYEKQISTKASNLILELPENLTWKELEKGLEIEYKITFKYKIADIVGKKKFKYDLFISTPNHRNPANTRMLVFNPEIPSKLLDVLTKQIHAGMRPTLAWIPTSDSKFTNCELFMIGESNVCDSNSGITAIQDGVFAISKFDDWLTKRLKQENLVSFQFIITSKGESKNIVLNFDAMYLEGIETNCIYTKDGGYGNTISVYHPEVYQGEFAKEITELIRLFYAKRLENYNIARINRGELDSILPTDKRTEVIAGIWNFIEQVRSKSFIPVFTRRSVISSSEEFTLSERRVMDFIIIRRKDRHELKIKISETPDS